MYWGCFPISLIQRVSSRSCYWVIVFMCPQLLTHIALKLPAVSLCWPPAVWDVPLTFRFWLIFAFFFSRRGSLYIRQCLYPTVFPKDRDDQDYYFLRGRWETRAHCHLFTSTAFVHNSAAGAWELGWSICRVCHNLQQRRIAWDTRSQIVNFADFDTTALPGRLLSVPCQLVKHWEEPIWGDISAQRVQKRGGNGITKREISK